MRFAFCTCRQIFDKINHACSKIRMKTLSKNLWWCILLPISVARNGFAYWKRSSKMEGKKSTMELKLITICTMYNLNGSIGMWTFMFWFYFINKKNYITRSNLCSNKMGTMNGSEKKNKQLNNLMKFTLQFVELAQITSSDTYKQLKTVTLVGFYFR